MHIFILFVALFFYQGAMALTCEDTLSLNQFKAEPLSPADVVTIYNYTGRSVGKTETGFIKSAGRTWERGSRQNHLEVMQYGVPYEAQGHWYIDVKYIDSRLQQGRREPLLKPMRWDVFYKEFFPEFGKGIKKNTWYLMAENNLAYTREKFVLEFAEVKEINGDEIVLKGQSGGVYRKSVKELAFSTLFWDMREMKAFRQFLAAGGKLKIYYYQRRAISMEEALTVEYNGLYAKILKLPEFDSRSGLTLIGEPAVYEMLASLLEQQAKILLVSDLRAFEAAVAPSAEPLSQAFRSEFLRYPNKDPLFLIGPETTEFNLRHEAEHYADFANGFDVQLKSRLQSWADKYSQNNKGDLINDVFRMIFEQRAYTVEVLEIELNRANKSQQVISRRGFGALGQAYEVFVQSEKASLKELFHQVYIDPVLPGLKELKGEDQQAYRALVQIIEGSIYKDSLFKLVYP